MSHSLTPQLFESRLLYHFGFDPTSGQQRLFHVFTRFVLSEKSRCGLIVKGYAGTGKTTSVRAMVSALEEAGFGIMLLAPTGRAAKVLSTYTGRPAKTIHKQIYIRRSDRTGRTWFELRESEVERTVFFVDEASMIGSERMDMIGDELASGDLLEDLMAHVFSRAGCRVVLIGDSAQLPPVGSDKSPALDLEFVRDRYNLHIAEVELQEVIRQKEGSAILENATSIRGEIGAGTSTYPSIVLSPQSKEMELVEGDIQPYVEEAMGKYGVDGLIILTRSNKRANLFNQQMRVRVLGHEEEINSGDRMMVVRNNYFWLEGTSSQIAGFIANGDIIEVTRVRSFVDRGEFRFCRAVIILADYPDVPEMEVILWCDTISGESANMSYAKMKELYQVISADYEDIENHGKRRKAIREDPFYNALQVKFAYAITVHKAQGGQWPCVFVDQGYLTEEMLGPEYNRWLYTAFTRAQEKLLLVGFDEKMITVKENPESQ